MSGDPQPRVERPRRPITVAIDPIALVITECITVTSAMRKHARWAHSSVSAILGAGASLHPPVDDKSGRSRKSSVATLNQPLDDDGLLAGRWGLRGKQGSSMQDNPLLSAFARLRTDMKHCKDIRTFDTITILHPFMQVIRSSSTTAPITSLALIAITKMLSYNVIAEGNPNFAQGLRLLSSTVTHCRFEAENTTTDEVVFLRILKLTEIMVTGPSGDLLGDESICEMMSCVLGLCCILRATEVVRRSAEISMVAMCQVIFQRLRMLDLESDGELQDPVEATQEELDKLTIDSTSTTLAETLSPSTQETSIQADATLDAIVVSSQIDLTASEDTAIRPYALPAVRELFKILADLLDPFIRERTDTMRIIALRIVNVALEVAGPSIAFQPSLASLAEDALCRNLFELVRSENVAVVHESLRVTGTLLATCRKVLKLQQELYLSYVVTCLHPRVPIPEDTGIDASLYDGIPQGPLLAKPVHTAATSGRSTPVPIKERQRLGMEGGSRKPDARESMVESVGALVRIPTFMVELFVNYDCQVDGASLCLDMVGLLSRNAIPDSATWSTTNVPPLCLDSLLTYIQSIADRIDDESVTQGLPDPAALRAQRARKAVIVKGVSKFNAKPTAGIAYLASQGIIDDPDNPVSVAQLLKETTRVDKKVLGEFLSKLQNYNILVAFMDMFDFRSLRADEALRILLNTFRLPGEAMLIERVVEVFAARYVATSCADVDKDAIFVLTYAIIMLNTDQHNPSIKNSARMTMDSFAVNLRGVNGGKDFDREYLQAIFDSIKHHEIILPEEHDSRQASEHAWSELLLKSKTASHLVLCNTNIYDADMFEATWQPVVATLNYVFMSATDDAVFIRITAGFQQCARIAAKYGLYDCLDRIVSSLGRISTLATESPPSTTLNTEVQVNGKSIMVSKFAVDFGREQRAQMAALILFRIANGHEHAIGDGWQYIIRIIVNLYINSLTPAFLSLLSRKLELPSIPLQSPAYVTSRVDKTDAGLFSAFTSYVSSVMNDEPPEPNDQEIEATLSTIECVTACRVDEVIAHIDQLPPATLKILASCVVNMLPQDASPRVIVVKPEVSAPTPVRPNGVKSQPQYDPAVVCLLELITVLAIRDAEIIELIGIDVAKTLQASIRNVDKLHPTAVSRLSYCLLSLVKASNDHDIIRAPVILHHIASFSQDLQKHSANNILKGLLECITGPTGLRNELATSPDFWSLLHSLRPLPDGAPLAFRIIEDIVPSAITADNYEPAVSLLDAFAVAGGTQDQQRGQAQGRRGRSQIPMPTEKTARSDTILRGVSAMHILQKLTKRVPVLITQSHLEVHDAWQTYWQPIFRILSAHCTNASRDIRQAAFSALQSALLSSDLASAQHQEWTKVFDVVLGLLSNVRLERSVAEIKVQAAQLLCRLYLQCLALLRSWDGMLKLWTDILDVMADCMLNKAGIALEEELPESLKNILLVMSGDGLLAPPTVPNRSELQKSLWAETHGRLENFLPGILKEVFPDAQMEVQTEQPKEARKLAPTVDDDTQGDDQAQPDPE